MRRTAARDRMTRHHDFDVRRGDALDGPRIGVAIGGKHQAGSDQIEYVSQLRQVGGDQRVGRRDRRVRNADVVRGEAEQGVLDIVAGQNDDRTLGGKLAADQRFPDASHAVERLGIGEAAPTASSFALREQDPIRRARRPIFEPFRQLLRIAGERFRRSQPNRAVGPAIGHHSRTAEANRANGWRVQSLIGHRLGHGGLPSAHRLTSGQPPSDSGRNACSPGIDEISLK